MKDVRAGGPAYVAVPSGGSGPGVLVVHSSWGLTPSLVTYADEGLVESTELDEVAAGAPEAASPATDRMSTFLAGEPT